jgi:alcohol dehydrogenase
MKALYYHKFEGPISLEDLPEPKISSHGAIMKVRSSGLCRSDWHGWMGHDPDIVLPHVPGHEWAGIVEEVGRDVKGFKAGDRVTAPFVCGCGSCEQCASGNHQVCDKQTQPGFTHWGSFAEYVYIDHADINLVKLPPEVDDITASLLGCRFITSYRAVVAQGKVNEGDLVAIHGCGGVGLSAIMIAHALGARVVAVDIREDTLKLTQELGAEFTINASGEQDVVGSIKDLTKGGVHVSLDALGSEITSHNSIACLRKRGKHIQVGLMTGNHTHPAVPMARVLSDELEIIGSHGMQAHKYPEMLEMIVDGRLKPEKLLEKTISLEEAAHFLPNMNAFEHKGVYVIDSF